MNMQRVIGRLNRRDLLLGAAAASASAPLMAATAAQKKKTGYIDAHVHVWTPDLDAYPLGEGYTKAQMRPPSFTPEELFAHTKPVGVDRIVLIQMSYYRFDNSYMLDMMKKHRGVFSGVAVIDEDAKPAETMVKMKARGVRGFRIRPLKGRTADRWLKTKGMQAMWRAGAEHQLAMCHLIRPEFLPSVDEACRRFPETPVVIDHFGLVGGGDGKIVKSDLDNLCKLARHKHVTIKTSAFYAIGKKKAPYKDLGPMIKRLVETFGARRLMWASDGPFQVVGGHHYKPSIDLIRGGLDFLTAEDKEWILGKTAERVFFS